MAMCNVSIIIIFMFFFFLSFIYLVLTLYHFKTEDMSPFEAHLNWRLSTPMFVHPNF